MRGRTGLFGRAAAATWAAVVLSFAPGRAEIERVTLAQLVKRVDGCVEGKIVAREAFRVDHPRDGAELYFTRVWIEGRSLFTGQTMTVPILFAGGVLSSGEGAWNSEAPSADDTRVGREVIAFYAWTDNMGGDVAGNALFGAHAGLYRIARTRKGDFVLGRGEGYAVAANAILSDLEKQVASLR